MNARYGPAPPERSTCTRRVYWFRRVVDVAVNNRRPRRHATPARATKGGATTELGFGGASTLGIELKTPVGRPVVWVLRQGLRPLVLAP